MLPLSVGIDVCSALRAHHAEGRVFLERDPVIAAAGIGASQSTPEPSLMI